MQRTAILTHRVLNREDGMNRAPQGLALGLDICINGGQDGKECHYKGCRREGMRA